MSEEDEGWESSSVIQALWRQAMLRRLHDDLITVMDRKLHEPVYQDPQITNEWVNEHLLDMVKERDATIERLTALLKTAGAHIEDAKPYMSSLLRPPPPWKEFGFHANHNPVPDVVFWGDDGTGLPIWERPKVLHDRETLAVVMATERRKRTGFSSKIGEPPLPQDYGNADAIIRHFESGMDAT